MEEMDSTSEAFAVKTIYSTRRAAEDLPRLGMHLRASWQCRCAGRRTILYDSTMMT